MYVSLREWDGDVLVAESLVDRGVELVQRRPAQRGLLDPAHELEVERGFAEFAETHAWRRIAEQVVVNILFHMAGEPDPFFFGFHLGNRNR